LVEIGQGQGGNTTELLPLIGRIHAIKLEQDLAGPPAERSAVPVNW
jgi:16S rRNA A1518/A1519 N6-dimethyltransferase RsmA/KsgA/DIM1 with predicted DNA glycosylase/AP lyase activity